MEAKHGKRWKPGPTRQGGDSCWMQQARGSSCSLEQGRGLENGAAPALCALCGETVASQPKNPEEASFIKT